MPVFVLRNDLPCSLQLHIDTARMDSCQQIEVQGHGKQQQVTMTGGDVTHHISFQLRYSYFSCVFFRKLNSHLSDVKNKTWYISLNFVVASSNHLLSV